MDNLEAWGKLHGLDAITLSHLSIEDLKMISRGVVATADIKNWIKNKANENQKFLKIIKSIELPPLISSKNDFSVFLYPETHPNFIGDEKIIAPCINLENADIAEISVENKCPHSSS